ncbi:MAG: hypothetical protein IKT56_05695 [Clostridia bacterium]|nr:hypothetical protein [Clostridia bacterium]
MPNYVRSVKTDLWIESRFRKFDAERKIVWFYLHTGYHSSETALYPCPIEDISLFCKISKKKTAEIIKDFCDMNLISYDSDTEEVLVLDYFDYHAPNMGLYYRMYSNDLAKIKSQKLIGELVEISKKYKISMAFFTALKDLRPDLKQEDFKVKKTDKTEDEIRDSDERGRKTAAANRNRAEIAEALGEKYPEKDFFEGMGELF